MDGDLPACALSLVIPAYNEEAGIAEALAQADDALRGLGGRYEILVVDDGSSDGTAAAVATVMQGRTCIRLLRHDANRGYGAALGTGFRAARGRLVSFTDADAQFDLGDLARLQPATEANDVVVGYRIDRQDPWIRKVYSRGYNLLVRTLLGTGVRDVDCALKVFRREALARLLPETSGFFVNAEMLTRARQLGLRVAEAGVRHLPRRRGHSKVSIGDIPRTLRVLLPFWWSQVLFPGAANGRANSPAPALRAGLLLALLVMTFALCFGRLGQPLLEPEEARYAEIPRQMLAEGRLLTPVLHGETYVQKPPLLYWLVMGCYRVLGVHDWAARVVPALAGVGTVLITALWGWRCLGFWTGLLAGGMLCLSGRFLYLAGMLNMDGLLCLCIVAALAAGHAALLERRLAWLLASAVCCGLGVLTKGPVALVLVAVPLVALAFLERRRLSWQALSLYLGIVLLVAMPWYAAVAAVAPDAAIEFLWLHNIVRYLAPLDHEQPVWYYAPSLLLGALPWTLLLLPMGPYLLRRSTRAGRRRPAPLGGFLLALVACLAFFSLSGCKRPAYILPAFPLLALSMATYVTYGLPWRRWLDRARAAHPVQQLGHRLALSLLACTCLLAVGGAAGMAVLGHWSWLQVLVVAVGLGAFMAIAWQLQQGSTAAMSWAGCAAALFVLLLLGVREALPHYHRRHVLRTQVQEQQDLAQAPMPIICYPKRYDSISFYLGRDVAAYAPDQKAALLRQLESQGEALLFVKRDGGALADLLQTLPEGWEFLQRGPAGTKVVTGVVRARP